MKSLIWLGIALALPALASAASKLPPPAASTVDFDRDVKPILKANCLGCHGSRQQQSGLRLDKRQNALRGGDYGAVIMPGNSAESKLILRVSGPDAGMQMPPTGPLSATDIGILRKWIDQGGDFPDVPLEAEYEQPKPTDPKVQSFIDAVRASDVAATRRRLREDQSLAKATDSAGATPLMHAALLGGTGVMQILLDAGADPNVKNHRNATPLHWAVTDINAVKLLLKNGADPNVKSVEGRTPLMLAAQQPGGVDIVKALLDGGADPNGKELTGRTPLMAAAASGDTEALRLLVAKGGRINASMASGSTPLISAAQARSLDSVKFLITQGADVNAHTKRGETALSAAAGWGSLEIV